MKRILWGLTKWNEVGWLFKVWILNAIVVATKFGSVHFLSMQAVIKASEQDIQNLTCFKFGWPCFHLIRIWGHCELWNSEKLLYTCDAFQSMYYSRISIPGEGQLHSFTVNELWRNLSPLVLKIDPWCLKYHRHSSRKKNGLCIMNQSCWIWIEFIFILLLFWILTYKIIVVDKCRRLFYKFDTHVGKMWNFGARKLIGSG